MWFAYSFLKDFFWSHPKIFARLQAKDMQNILKIIKRLYSGLIQSYVQTWLVKNEKETISLPMLMFTLFHRCKWMHKVFWKEIYPSTTVLLLFMLVLHSSLWRGEDARDAWCSGSKAQFAAFDFSTFLELPLAHPTGRGKEKGVIFQ